MTDSKRRFSGRVENYVRYRPGYPAEVLDLLRRRCGLAEESEVADVGSGTGALARLFLENGNQVFGVEPNPEMRLAGERLLRGYERFTSVAASAEETTLPDGSVAFVTAGQAFHWFDPGPARGEFARILKPGGAVALIWNARRKEGEPFLAGYEQLLRSHGTDYREVHHGRRGSPESIRDFFYPDPVEEATFENRQGFDLEGLKGRLLSSSYVPDTGEPSRDTRRSWRPQAASLKSTKSRDRSSSSMIPGSSSARSPDRRRPTTVRRIGLAPPSGRLR